VLHNAALTVADTTGQSVVVLNCLLSCSFFNSFYHAVRAEMVEEKGLPGEVADTIGQFVVLR
jgi:hypothetical protein